MLSARISKTGRYTNGLLLPEDPTFGAKPRPECSTNFFLGRTHSFNLSLSFPRFVAWPLELGLGTHNPRFFAWPLELGLGTHNPRFLPSCAINDASCTVKVGSAAPTSGTCVVCNHVVPLHSMRTHVGRHILRDECGADACGFCGGNACTTELLRNGQGKLVSVILTSCPLEPTNVRWGAMAKASARSPCTNRPMHCTLCKATVWLYGMKMHFDAKHPDVAPPATLCAPTSERDVALAWTAHDEKKEKKKTADDA